MIRISAIRLDAVRYDADGFLHAEALLTKSGVFAYRTPDGTVRHELRHPDDVFRADSMNTAKRRPIVDGHPYDEPGMIVTPESARKLTVGFSGDDVRQDGEAMLGTVTVTDGAVIDKVKAGKREVSMGYRCDLIDESGDYNGQRYEVRQKNIQYNHIAIEHRARMGHDTRIRLDAADAVAEDMADVWYSRNKVDSTNGVDMVKTRIKFPKVETAAYRCDEMTVEIPAEDAKSVEAAEVSYEQMAKIIGDLQKRVAELEGENTALKSEKEKTDKELTEVKADSALDKIHAAAVERAELLGIATHVKVDGVEKMTNPELRRAIVEKHRTVKLDGVSDENIGGQFSVVKDALVKEIGALTKLQALAPHASVTNTVKADGEKDPQAEYHKAREASYLASKN